MSQTMSLEERVKALEAEVAELKRRVRPRESLPEWLERISGRMAGYPEFDEVIRLGREIRRADRPEEESAGTA